MYAGSSRHLLAWLKDVDGRDGAGHDELWIARNEGLGLPFLNVVARLRPDHAFLAAGAVCGWPGWSLDGEDSVPAMKDSKATTSQRHAGLTELSCCGVAKAWLRDVDGRDGAL